MASLFHYSVLALFVVCLLQIKKASSQSPATQALIDKICANSAHDIPADYLFCQDFYQQHTQLSPNSDLHALNQIVITSTYQNVSLAEKKVVEIWDSHKDFDPPGAKLFGICDDHYNKVISEYEFVIGGFNKGDFNFAKSREANCPALIQDCKRLVESIQSLLMNKLNLDMIRLTTMSLAAIQLLIDS